MIEPAIFQRCHFLAEDDMSRLRFTGRSEPLLCSELERDLNPLRQLTNRGVVRCEPSRHNWLGQRLGWIGESFDDSHQGYAAHHRIRNFALQDSRVN